MAKFIRDFMMKRHGVRGAAEAAVEQLRASVKQHAQLHRRLVLFGNLIGTERRTLGRPGAPPWSDNKIDFALALIT